METKEYRYTDAFEELQQIVAEIESGDVNVDELAERIKRASQLIGICKAKLISSEEEVDRLLAQLQTADTTENDSKDGEDLMSEEE